jgi:cytochrome c oxidase subunit IV
MVRDDLNRDNEYALSANHDEAHGVELRKMIWKVTGLLTLITVVEVLTGAFVKQYIDGTPNSIWPVIKWSFIVLTLIKAAYIVLKFMHLGDETKSFKYVLLTPYFIFMAYLIFILLTEAYHVNSILYP